jgi:hypothetical protein
MAGWTLGFAGLLAAGVDPQEAYEQVRARCADPAVRAVLAELTHTPQGCAALEASRERWAAYGFPPPWEDAL